MHFSTIFAPLLAAVAVAQNAPSGGAGATPPGSVMVQVVKVGGANGELKFEPEDIQAPPGSMVQFQFYPKNHSVAQSTFAQPCMPISQSMPNVTNTLWSGFMPTAPDAKMMATWTIMVNDTTPIWLYCAQGKHCQSGMVAGINAKPTGDKTVAAFKAAAAKAQSNVAPNGGAAPAGNTAGGNSTGSPASSTGSGPSTGGSAPGGSPASPSSSSSAGNVKATGAASTVSYASSTMVLAGLLSVFVTYAL